MAQRLIKLGERKRELSEVQMSNNYILITIDALRADHLNIYGYEKRVTSPAIDQFAKRSNIYLNAYACGVPTQLSFPSIFCSIYPSKVMHNMYLPKSIPTFVELLKDKGFQTAAFIDYNPYCSSLLGYGRGFDLLQDYFADSLKSNQRLSINFSNIPELIHSIGRSIPIPLPPLSRFLEYLISTELVQPGTSARQMIQNAIRFMNSSRKNFFVWLHFMDVHYPYSFPNYKNPLMKYKVLKARRLASPIPRNSEYVEEELVQLMEEMYDASIRRLDARLEVLFDSLQKGGILEDTYVFITSDHGEELLTRGLFLTHHENVYEEVTHVPLIIKKPDSQQLVKSESIISLLDIPTTILINEKISVPKEYEGGLIFQGKRGYAISETIVPYSNEFAKNWRDQFRAQFNGFIYSIRDVQYTVIYDRDNAYKFFDRKEDAMEKGESKLPNGRLLNLLDLLKEHQLKSLSAEKKRVKARIGELKALGKV